MSFSSVKRVKNKATECENTYTNHISAKIFLPTL